MPQCFIDVDVDDGSDFQSTKIVTARKDYKCCECRGTIHKGEKYENVFMAFDGTSTVYKTCSICQEIRDALFCSWYFERVWEELWNTERWEGGIPMCAFNGFSKEAIERLSSFFDEVNDSEGEE